MCEHVNEKCCGVRNVVVECILCYSERDWTKFDRLPKWARGGNEQRRA